MFRNIKILLTDMLRYAAKNITNKAGKELQAEVWKEVLEVLEAAVPEVTGIVHSKL